MRTFLTLDYYGLVLAAALGVAIFFLGMGNGGYYLVVLIIFLLLSSFVTNFGRKVKRRRGVYESRRTWKNVAANGLMPLIVVALSASGVIGGSIALAAYAAVVAGITADKFASEIGTLGPRPVMMLTLKKVKIGTSGGVTVEGLAASFIGSLIIALTVFNAGGVFAVVVIAISGWIGGIADSALGFFEEKGYGNKYTSNFGCACTAFIAALLFLILL